MARYAYVCWLARQQAGRFSDQQTISVAGGVGWGIAAATGLVSARGEERYCTNCVAPRGEAKTGEDNAAADLVEAVAFQKRKHRN